VEERGVVDIGYLNTRKTKTVRMRGLEREMGERWALGRLGLQSDSGTQFV